jgi:hypothetical protein
MRHKVDVISFVFYTHLGRRKTSSRVNGAAMVPQKKKRIFRKRTYKLISTYRLSFSFLCLLKKHFLPTSPSSFHRRLSLCVRFWGEFPPSAGCHMCIFYIFRTFLRFGGDIFCIFLVCIMWVLYYCLTLPPPPPLPEKKREKPLRYG